ncbi:MAG: metallophosphoesterase family protein [Zavarzinella sp.]
MARTLAIGDIHGCINALLTLEKFVGFQESDTIITLGDYVDRGPNSCAVIDWLIFTNQKRKLIPLRGNHDLMMLKASTDRKWKHDWMAAGGEATLRSYSPFDHDPGSMVDIPETHWDFLENHLLPYYETDTHIFVHANLLPDLPMSEQPEYYLYWQDFDDNSGHESGKIMVCGHNSQKSGRPKLNGNAVCIDTYVYGSGWLTCLDVGTGKVWQSNENGDTRVYILQEYNYDN